MAKKQKKDHRIHMGYGTLVDGQWVMSSLQETAMIRLQAAVMAHDLLEDAYRLADQLYIDVHRPRNRVPGVAPTQWHTIVDGIGEAQLKVADEIVSLAREACQSNQPKEDTP